MDDQLKKYWQAFCKKHNLLLSTPVDAWTFGATDADADKLSQLVNGGIKTATTSAYELYEKDEPLPQAGEYSIILNSQGEPICVIQDKCVEIIPYNLISAEHAYHEGEGDRSYQYWRQVHDEFFTREYAEQGKTFYPQALMVCEVFEKIE
ncbi:MAG: ASCH domain-containing protein [Lactobacillus sp.]|jgi:uncharacterized protein YhfF|nr:ASCH domain-containing protein [Lactobacillus sp.]MCH3906264.1 ASCH domain-containing protein [Lactobacillus sp.]MCH3990160.1 ASCH domain-containing protein [Lactobacillus sp.]MCH4069126.1 ASCH domain-containing protein [Lactobacillus sp.]MCI1303887.1 ASCH domain-containing protein [Lactobacillus sp.]